MKIKIIITWLVFNGFATAQNTPITVATVTVGDNYIPENATLSKGRPDLRAPVSVTLTVDGKQKDGIDVTPLSSRIGADSFVAASGKTQFSGYLKTRERSPDLVVSALGASSPSHNMLPAVYRTSFAITGYFTPREVSGGVKVDAAELTTQNPSKRYIITSAHSGRVEFLRKVAIEGEGYFDDGSHAAATNHTRPGTSDPIIIDSTITIDTTQPTGSTGATLVADSSCAVVFTVIPKSAQIEIAGYGGRSAVDTVSSSQTGGVYHIDLYKGFDETAANQISDTRSVTLNSY
jgi:hypothetical protein